MSNRGHARSDSAGLTGSFCLLSGPSSDALCSSRSHGPGDNAAGHLDLKIRERKARMSGYDSPQQYDMTLVAELRRPSSADAIKMEPSTPRSSRFKCNSLDLRRRATSYRRSPEELQPGVPLDTLAKLRVSNPGRGPHSIIGPIAVNKAGSCRSFMVRSAN